MPSSPRTSASYACLKACPKEVGCRSAGADSGVFATHPDGRLRELFIFHQLADLLKDNLAIPHELGSANTGSRKGIV
eukprot:3601561-Rhodomonas_salina.1